MASVRHDISRRVLFLRCRQAARTRDQIPLLRQHGQDQRHEAWCHRHEVRHPAEGAAMLARRARSIMAVRSATINVMAGAALKAARSLIRDFGEVEQLQVSMKGPADFVSEADLKAEKTIRMELQKARPGFGFLMEESGASQGGDGKHRWIV